MFISTFFLVDDNTVLLDIYRDVLALKGHEVVGTANDGEECVEKLSNSGPPPDFVILDHRMPIMDGIILRSFIRRI